MVCICTVEPFIYWGTLCFQFLTGTRGVPTNNCLWAFVGTSFHFSRINASECNCWVVWWMYCFLLFLLFKWAPRPARSPAQGLNLLWPYGQDQNWDRKSGAQLTKAPRHTDGSFFKEMAIFWKMTIFQSGCYIILHSHQQHTRESISIFTSTWYCHQFWVWTISQAYKCYLIVVIICISLTPTDVKHLFMGLFATRRSSSVQYLHVFCPFSNWIF